MVLDKYSIDGKITGKVDLPDSIFNVQVNDVLVYEMIRASNANLRQGTHSVKKRAEVRGGGAKPWRQKGTGRARQGTIRAPQWKGGGVVFGPAPRDYSIRLPKKIRKEAMISLFSLKIKENAVKVIEDFSIKDGKTREIVAIAKSLQVGNGLLVTKDDDKLVKRAIKNIPWLMYNNVIRISGRDIFYSKTVLITESALKHIAAKYGNEKK